MIKKFRIFLIFTLLLSTKSMALSPKHEKELYLGCYTNSKAYIGADKAKNYCLCTINMLSEKFSDSEIDLIFKKEPEEIMKATEFAAIHCEKHELS